MAARREVRTPALKAQVALAAVWGDRTANELAAHFGVHPALIHAWKKHPVAGAGQGFAGGARAAPADDKSVEFYEQIGRLKVDLDWVEKRLLRSADELRGLVDHGRPGVSVRRQYERLGLNRSTAYYRPPRRPPSWP